MRYPNQVVAGKNSSSSGRELIHLSTLGPGLAPLTSEITFEFSSQDRKEG